MAQHYQGPIVDLVFNADTAQIKKELRSLKQELISLSDMTTVELLDLGGFEASIADLKKASNAAAELQAHLRFAENLDTGRLDLSKLNQSLKASKKTLIDYANELKVIGPSGAAAFDHLTDAILQA